MSDTADDWVDDPFATTSAPKVRRSMAKVHPADRLAKAIEKRMATTSPASSAPAAP